MAQWMQPGWQEDSGLASARPAARWRHVGSWGWAGRCYLFASLLMIILVQPDAGTGCDRDHSAM
jgi:hypothetical protein